jgi:hypothetical protein
MGACSGGDNTIVGQPVIPGGTPPVDVATLTLLTSSPQIPSDGSSDAVITALVRDVNNNVMPDIGVVFSANSGSLVTAQPSTTDANGVLTATLSTGGDKSLRDISVTAIANGTAQANVTVAVNGTTLQIDGPNSLPLGENGNYSVVLTDAGGNGISTTDVTLTSSNGNSLSASSVITNSLGEAAFVLTASNGGLDTITADALGASFAKEVNVSLDSFSFNSPPPPPAAVTEIDLGANLVVEVVWEDNGVGVANRPISFATTRGTVSAGTVNTNASGVASITVSANTAGPALITATNDDQTSIQINVEFVATTPDTLELQANPFTVSTNDQSAITAVVRDANGNLVKNQVVSFVLTDSTNGSLSVGQATTNSQGRAQTIYNASSSSSAVDGVRIDATVQGFAGATDTVFLTVAQRQAFISIGTGNEIFEENSAQYRKEWIIQVTDAQGNGVDMVDVSVSLLSERYWDGVRAYLDPPGTWVTRPGFEAFPAPGCVDEDADRDGILDLPGEDANGNNRIEAGNIATAVAQNGGGSTVTTDINGFALIDVYWPQEYAYWLEVTMEARTSVQGSEYAEATTFLLSGSVEDFSNENVTPPGVTSPFGTDGNCGTPPPPDGP